MRLKTPIGPASLTICREGPRSRRPALSGVALSGVALWAAESKGGHVLSPSTKY